MPKDFLGAGRRLAIYRPVLDSNVLLPFFSYTVSAGFPSPADDHLQNKIDLNAHLIDNPPATYIMQVSGMSMIGKDIHDRDWLVVDRSKEAKHKSVIVAILDGEVVCKTFHKRNGKAQLVPENTAFKPIDITDEMDFEVWGVVTFSIHDHR